MQEDRDEIWSSVPWESLAQLGAVRTDDFEKARDASSRIYAPHYPTTLEADRHTEPLGCYLNAAQFGAVTCADLKFNSAIRLTSEGNLDSMVVGMPLAGHVRGLQHRTEIEAGPGAAWILPRGSSLSIRMSSHIHQVSLIIASNAIERHLRNLLGRELDQPLVFAPVVDNVYWKPTIALVSQILEDGRELTPAVLSHLGQTVLTTLLVTHRNSYSDHLAIAAGSVVPRTLRRAREAIEDSPEQPWSAATIASIAGVSVRSLQVAFHRHYGVTPMRYLQEVRLRHAHTRLRAGDDSTTVTQVALDLGFTHLGRFAAKYRERYGQSPSETLRLRR